MNRCRSLPITACAAVAGISLILSGTLLPLGPPPDTPAAVVPLLLNGEPSTRINLAVLAEGYTEPELNRFISDAEALVEYFFAQDPFADYAAFFNVFAVPVASAESGSDHPSRGIFRDTYFNSSFESWGLPHGLTIPPNNFDPDPANGFGKARDLLDLVFPEYDLIVIVVNDKEYGGWGDRRGAVTSVHTSANDTLTHEMAHAFAELGDEYTHPFPNDPEPVREEPNTTTETRREWIKWKAWINDDTPIPTPTGLDPSTIGLFEGARYQSKGWYRPRQDCRMRSQWVPFCEVCREAIIQSVYRRVSPVVGAEPDSTTAVAGLHRLEFHLDLVEPASHPLDVDWELDGSPLLRGGTEGPVLETVRLGNGRFQVLARISDTTEAVRNDPEGLLTFEKVWELVVSGVEEEMSPLFYFPAWRKDAGLFTGYAFSNYSDAEASIDLQPYDAAGTALGTVPVSPLRLDVGLQIARLGIELFPAAADQTRWFVAEADTNRIGTLFLIGDGRSRLDGSIAPSLPAKELYFVDFRDGEDSVRGHRATGSLLIGNPNDHQIEVRFEAFSGGSGPSAVGTYVLPAFGHLEVDSGEAFGGPPGGYLKVSVTRGAGCVGYLLMSTEEPGSFFGLNGGIVSDANHAYSAQLAWGSSIFTLVKLINSGSEERLIRLRVTSDSGTELGLQTRTIPAGGVLTVEATELTSVEDAGNGPTTGSLSVEADGPGVLGTVLMGHPDLRYATVVPLQETLLREALFSHVAETKEIFTGLALFNPGETVADIRVAVVSPDGVEIGGQSLVLGPGGRTARLLSELIPAARGQAGGYFRVESSHPIAAQGIFGDYAGRYYSAVVPRIVDVPTSDLP